MQHINKYSLFEAKRDILADNYKKRINWKFINFVQYTMQEVEDEGYETNIIIAVMVYDKYRHNTSMNNIWTSRNGYSKYTQEELSILELAYEDNGLYFIIRMQKDEESGLDFNKEKEIYEKIKKVYNIIPDKTEENEKIRFYKIPN